MPKIRGEIGGPIDQAFGRLLREMRLERGWSQEKLAEVCDCDRGYLSLLERGRNSPSLSMVTQLSRAFGLRPSEMLTRVEESLGGEPESWYRAATLTAQQTRDAGE